MFGRNRRRSICAVPPGACGGGLRSRWLVNTLLQSQRTCPSSVGNSRAWFRGSTPLSSCSRAHRRTPWRDRCLSFRHWRLILQAHTVSEEIRDDPRRVRIVRADRSPVRQSDLDASRRRECRFHLIPGMECEQLREPLCAGDPSCSNLTKSPRPIPQSPAGRNRQLVSPLSEHRLYGIAPQFGHAAEPAQTVSTQWPSMASPYINRRSTKVSRKFHGSSTEVPPGVPRNFHGASMD
jgi:hypothetical protein